MGGGRNGKWDLLNQAVAKMLIKEKHDLTEEDHKSYCPKVNYRDKESATICVFIAAER